MGQRRHFHHNKRQIARASSPETRGLRRPPAVTERVPQNVYGKPYIVLEDHNKNTFIYQAGSWVPHSATIAECRQTCQVKELAQRLNHMVRYEVRCPE
jgi:hypothetical protein